MANSVTWQDLLAIYQNAKWITDGSANVHIADEGILETLRLVETSDRAAFEADLNLLVDPASMTVGQTVPVRIGAPQLRLGVLAADWNGVIASPEGRIRERANYYVIADGVHSGSTPPPETMVRYRAMLKLVSILSRAALFLDAQRQALVFYKERRIEIPVRYVASNLRLLDLDGVYSLEAALEGAVHAEQRHAILADAVISLVEGQPTEDRFIYLAQNTLELSSRITEGYKLFASSFSYSKIRGEIEATQSDYIARIHKTFTDIQGQLLGLPIASVVVATQLRPVEACELNVWTNIAVVGGAWLFALLLLASCLNQWLTLNAIHTDIERQRDKLDREYHELKHIFSGAFETIARRLCWHRVALIAISAVAIGGAAFATVVFRAVTAVDVFQCIK